MAHDIRADIVRPSVNCYMAALTINEAIQKGELIRLTDYCRATGSTRQNVHRLVLDGAIPHLRIGNVSYLTLNKKPL